MTRNKNASKPPVSITLETRIGLDGIIQVPPAIRTGLSRMQGRRVVVHITDLRLTEGLEAHGVTEDLIDRITSVQREERGNVVRCLLSEGRLRRNKRLVAWAKGTGG